MISHFSINIFYYFHIEQYYIYVMLYTMEKYIIETLYCRLRHHLRPFLVCWWRLEIVTRPCGSHLKMKEKKRNPVFSSIQRHNSFNRSNLKEGTNIRRERE